MSDKNEFLLPRLYHRPGGIEDGAPPVGSMIAATQGLTRVHWDECRRYGPLLTPPPQHYPQGALGLFRGQTVDFILAHAHVDGGGQSVVQYVLMPTDAARAAAGRPKLFLALADIEKRFESASKNVPPHVFKVPPAASPEVQADDLQAFMLLVNDDFEVVEGLLAALVQGMPVGILRGARELDQQLTFLQGLLTLLPAPARFGVTFSTFLRRPDPPMVQFAFLANDAPPSGYLCYDCEAGRLVGSPPDDPYSRFIVQQLRLDVSLALDQTSALTRTAGWRLTRRESLAEALGWAAKRAALDAAVSEGQPADSDMVAHVLRDDPTLPDDLRLRYVRHLLAFAIGLEELETADIIAILARAHNDVAEEVAGMLDRAASEGKALFVYRLVARWLLDPLGPEGWSWRTRAHDDALTHLRACVQAGDMAGVVSFLEELQEPSVGEALMIREIAPDVLNVVLPAIPGSPDLAQALFLLAASYLPAKPFQQLMENPNFTAQLSGKLKDSLEHFEPSLPTPAPRGLLTELAVDFGGQHEPLVLARLVEWATLLDRPDLIDTPVLERLTLLTRPEWRDRFQSMLRQVAQAMSARESLVVLEDPGPRLLVELMLRMGEYEQVVALLDRVSTALFPGEVQRDFPAWVSEVFEHTALEPAELLSAMEVLARRGVRPVPRAMAYRGALINHGYNAALLPLVRQLSDALVSDSRLVDIVGVDVALSLLRSHAQQQDLKQALQLGTAITDSVVPSKEGLKIVGQLWTMFNWDQDARQAALELMRRYIRQLPPHQAAAIPERVGRRLGSRVQEMLQATVIMTTALGDHDFVALTEQVEIAALLLLDIAAPYVEKPYPTLHRLKGDLDALGGGLGEEDRQQISEDALAVARAIQRLGALRSGAKGRKRSTVELQLLGGEGSPRSAVDTLLWLSSYFAEGESEEPLVPSTELDLKHGVLNHVMGDRSVTFVRDEMHTIRDLLERLLAAFPAEGSAVSADVLRAEIDSLWAGVRLFDQRRLRPKLVEYLPKLAALLSLISDDGDEKAIGDTSLGQKLESARQEPRSALEVLRLISGYFGRKFTI